MKKPSKTQTTAKRSNAIGASEPRSTFSSAISSKSSATEASTRSTLNESSIPNDQALNPSASSPSSNDTTARCGNQKSEIRTHTSKTRTRPFQPLPEFASLPREQLDYIQDLIRTKTYEDAQQEIWSSLGCRISTSRLQRYREKIELASALEIAAEEDTTPALDRLNDLLAGRETNIPAAGIHLIQQRALALAAAPKTSPTLLKDLFRIFTYADRKNDLAQRRKIAEQRETTRQQTAANHLELRRAMNEHRKQIDHHHARLADQREQTRKRMADLAERAQNLREQLASHRNSTESQDELTERADAVMAFGREFLRRSEAGAPAQPGSAPLPRGTAPDQPFDNPITTGAPGQMIERT